MITYSADHQEQIALLLSRKVYTALSTPQKNAIDNGWSTGTPGGAAGRALNVLGQFANMYAADDFDTIPETWTAWFVLEAAVQAAAAFPTAEITDLRRTLLATRRDTLISASRGTYDSSADGDIGTFTSESIRADVIANALRQQRGSLFLEPSMVDSVIEDVVAEIWNEADWSFKRKQVTLTIATNGTVTSSDDVSVDRVIGDRIYYDPAFGGTCLSVDYETILDYKSSNASAGKPSYFHLLRSGDDLDWLFNRTPDIEYTAKAMVTAQTPTMTNRSTMDAGLLLFPTDFRSVIKNRVLAICLLRNGRTSVANPLMEETTMKMSSLLVRYDSTGGDVQHSEISGYSVQGLGWNTGHIGGAGL